MSVFADSPEYLAALEEYRAEALETLARVEPYTMGAMVAHTNCYGRTWHWDHAAIGKGHALEDIRPLFPHTGYGYGTTSLEHSNTDRIREDYAGVTASDTADGVMLAPFDDRGRPMLEDGEGYPDAAALRDVADVLVGLYEYPVYDEGDYSTLEMERCESWWLERQWPDDVVDAAAEALEVDAGTLPEWVTDDRTALAALRSLDYLDIEEDAYFLPKSDADALAATLADAIRAGATGWPAGN